VARHALFGVNFATGKTLRRSGLNKSSQQDHKPQTEPTGAPQERHRYQSKLNSGEKSIGSCAIPSPAVAF
jgi:hypothetical protein